MGPLWTEQKYVSVYVCAMDFQLQITLLLLFAM